LSPITILCAISFTILLAMVKMVDYMLGLVFGFNLQILKLNLENESFFVNVCTRFSIFNNFSRDIARDIANNISGMFEWMGNFQELRMMLLVSFAMLCATLCAMMPRFFGTILVLFAGIAI